MITNKDKELLEDYILDKTSEVENVEIESRLNSDQEYKNEFKDLLILSNSIENFEKYFEKKKLLEKINFSEKIDKKSFNFLNTVFNHKIAIGIAASVLFIIGFNKLILNYNLNNTQQEIQLYGTPFENDSSINDSLINDSSFIIQNR